MKKLSKKSLIISVLAILLIGFTALVIHNYKNKTSFKYFGKTAEELKPDITKEQDLVNQELMKDQEKLAETRKNSELLKILPNDYVIGDSDAKVLIIEYASLSCPHCAVFYREAYEKIKEDYISKGKVKFIYRDFPLNQQALTAGTIAECIAKDSKENATEKYHETIKILFKTQDSWAFDSKYDEKLEAIMKLDGMGQERFKSCINDKQLQDKILAKRMDASNSLQIRSTPTFFVNGEISEGYIDYLTLQKLIEKNLK
jgi:protein-disulfide isomerase